MAVRAKLGACSTLRKCVEAMCDLATEVNFVFDKRGMHCQTMDSSHVSLISFCLPKSQMSEYSCEKDLCTGVNLVNLQKALRTGNADNTVTLLIKDKSSTLNIVFESDGVLKGEFDLKLIDLETDTLEITPMNPSCKVKTPAVGFQKILKNLAVIGDEFTITVTQGQVKFSTGGDIGNASMTLKESTEAEGLKTTIECGQEWTVRLALKHMISFAKATPLSDYVELEFTENMPVRVHYTIENDKGFIDFLLAPKLGEE
jgi:proliferating cell nuclear antigen